jgi:hypothetical protein
MLWINTRRGKFWINLYISCVFGVDGIIETGKPPVVKMMRIEIMRILDTNKGKTRIYIIFCIKALYGIRA